MVEIKQIQVISLKIICFGTPFTYVCIMEGGIKKWETVIIPSCKLGTLKFKLNKSFFNSLYPRLVVKTIYNF